ncbi:hypothetical protein ACJIZ3_009197 [Penstemon smallii]|uniref:Uncharacterized protein n=1 Tax=Penstemon smallii TaxID=265156 RepID=A0ABD3TCX7_9LAMI
MSIDKKEDGSSTRHKSVNSELELAGDSKGNTVDDLMADPCIDYAFRILTDAIPMELAIKTLTTAIPIDDVKKVGENATSSTASPNNQTAASSSVLPYDDVWTDPCFEHAIKMFTDEIAKDGGLSDSSFHHGVEGGRGKFS